ncbi:hypothetical protein [Mesorhizobium sp. B2-3-4]|uniref:hypothetical protein n=1 Tax=Mesorhizobium sp. B2-3-4 TaxID=2589959 RepID=UPI00112AE006|nr:hypothetical protein [Mesorhizobium sp. B2-3-4]TPM41402.1 hypothetical protein FJ967_00245 [Mesorhizobium sp. B2-3-4]
MNLTDIKENITAQVDSLKDELKGRLENIRDAVAEIEDEIDDFNTEGMDSDRLCAVVDVRGRIYLDGVHVGYVKKGLPALEMGQICDHLGCIAPALQDEFIAFPEPEQE